MTKEELADTLNEREYGNEMTKDEGAAAKESGLVVVFGASDDLMEFSGAINDEVGAWDGGTAYLTKEGLFEACDEECKYSKAAKTQAKSITAIWGEGNAEEPGYSWTYKTDIPHAIFDILEDGQPWCRGIVFSMGDL